jgi:outer membrane protein assembly factor BamB
MQNQALEASVIDHGMANPGISLWPAETIDGVTYLATRSGRPVRAAAFDHDTKKVTGNYTLPRGPEQLAGVGTLALEAREDVVYFETRADGRLYRLDRETEEVEIVTKYGGSYVVTMSLESAPDGTVYASTAEPNCMVYEIGPSSGSVTEIGPIAENEKYAYDLEVTESSVYVGVQNGDNSGLYEVDRESHDITHLYPNLIERRVRKVDRNDRFIVAHNAGNTTTIADTESESNSRVETQLPMEVTLHPDEDRLYYPAFPSWGWSEDGVYDPEEAAMYAYDLETGDREKLFPIPDLEGEVGGSLNPRTTHIREGKYIAVQKPKAPNLFVADLVSETATLYNLPDRGMEPTAVNNQSVGQFEGKPVTSRNGAAFIHDLESESRTELPVDGEAKNMIEVDGRLYLGIYNGAIFYVYDGESLERIGSIEGESRPQDLIYNEAANAVMMATQPDYGAETGGAIGFLDLSTHEISAYKNVIEDQSVRSLAITDDALYAGGETRRGHGTQKVTSTGKLARFDPVTVEKQWEVAPVDGAGRIWDLFATENRVIGVASGTIFAVDPETGTVQDTADLGSGQQHHRGSDGSYYGVVRNMDDNAGGITRIEPGTLAVNTFQREDVYARLGESTLIDGTMFWVDAGTWNLMSVESVSEFQ